MQSTWIEALVVAAVSAGVPPDGDVRGVRRLLVEHHVATRLHRRVQPDAELGDDVGALTGVRDHLAEHLRSAAAGDLDDTPCFEAQRDRLVDQSVDRVRNGEVGDEHAVGAVPQRRDEDFAARVVREPPVFEAERVRQPAASLDVQCQVGACAPANANPGFEPSRSASKRRAGSSRSAAGCESSPSSSSGVTKPR